ncbi:MAG: glycerol kinase GlpK [Candidatus Pelagadaptatus aseana]|uniref:glycerol kinase GlpK n=1 Tax=Candidatus Pelagadaptatus aseana TaxID=3120508 RepID=UPI0039B1BA40
MPDYILAIDQGTTSTRAILFDHRGQPKSQAQQEFEQIFPHDGWVEHDPEAIWESTLSVCRKAMEKLNIDTSHISCIGITNQRETTIVWDKNTGKPVYNAIVWQDRRTAAQCEQLKADGFEDMVHAKTGLLLDPYFSATKIAWILDHQPGLRAQAEQGELLFGTVDSYLLWRLSDGISHKTDATNASRTLIYNIHSGEWDNELLELFNIPAAILPEVLDSSASFGDTNVFDHSIPITGIAGDQQAALFGQTCFEPGMVKSTYGTGCFMILNTGDQAVDSQHRMLTTIGYQLNGKPSYAIEGSIFVAGAAIQWLRDGLQLISKAKHTEKLASKANPDANVYMVPAFTGLGAPYWDPQARGALLGLTRDTGIEEVVAAGILSVCYQTRDLLEAMNKDGANLPDTLRVDGGMVKNNWFVQSLADTLATRVQRPTITETTALGAAYLAGLQLGIFESLEQLADLWQCDNTFESAIDDNQRNRRYKGWLEAVERVKSKPELTH